LFKSLLALMGVLAPHLRTLDVSARSPIDKRGNFPASVSSKSLLNISTTSQKSYPKFEYPRTTFQNSPPPQIIFFDWDPYIFFDLGALASETLAAFFLVEKKGPQKERSKKKNNAKYYVSACSQGQRTHSARTKIYIMSGLKLSFIYYVIPSVIG
jgi:hypothetical protein